MERKLTAILSADVKGYSRLMGEDEEATIRTLTAYRTVMATFIMQHHGRVVDSPGDNLLAEFASVVDAVRCAVTIQQELKARNAELSDHRKMEFRIGLNLGDVVIEGERLYGDGVNIAARLESLAEPGGLCISGTVYDHVENKLALTYEYLGEQTVKNIAKPVRVWRVLMDGVAALMVSQSVLQHAQHERPEKRRVGTAHRAWLVVAGLLIVGALVTLLYPSLPTLRTLHFALHDQEALPLPDKPSIAVLPFVNLSGDPEQEYFSDGMTEDLITDLSKLSGLFVIARNSVFFYKGKAVKLEQVSRELGVRYVLEGSVRKADDRVRITAQLVDATTDYHLWAERYDRPLQEIFVLQDEVRQKIVTTLNLQLTSWEQGIPVRKRTDNLEAYDYLLRGAESSLRETKEANAQARQLYEKAVELDPQYAEAYAALGWTYWMEWFSQWSQDPQTLERAFALAQKAIALDGSLPGAHYLLSEAYAWKKQPAQAMAEAERVVALDPNYAEGYLMLGRLVTLAGRPEEGLKLGEKAMRLNPHYPYYYLDHLGWVYYYTGRYEQALAPLKSALARNPDSRISHMGLAVTYSELGREEEARAEVAECLRLSPTLSLEGLRQTVPFTDQVLFERFLNDMRKAGLK